MTIDTHAHLGLDEVFDEDFTEAELLESQRNSGIALTIVQPALVHDLPTVQRYHDAIADLAERYPGRFAGMADPNPHLPGAAYDREVRRCINDLEFVGVKLHPLAHAVNPIGRHGRRVFELAADLGVPVMVHTGLGLPWSALDPVAAAQPELTIVAAHAGGGMCAAEALQLAQRNANVYLECSWTAGFFVRHCVEVLGAERLMFGSDHADNAATELAKFRSAGLTDTQLDWVLSRSANAVFALRTVLNRKPHCPGRSGGDDANDVRIDQP